MSTTKRIPMIAGLGAKQKAQKHGAKTAKATSAIPVSQSAKSAAGVGKRGSKSGSGGGSGGMSGLDAAAKVLADSGKPGGLTSQEIVNAMLKAGLWKTGGKTPHATIYAAMIREIAKKGSNGRFRKTDRGHFTVAKHAK